MDDIDFVFGLILGIFVGAFILFFVFGVTGNLPSDINKRWEADAIAAGCAQYNGTTAEFEWTPK